MKIPRRGLPLLALVFSLVGFLGEVVPAEALALLAAAPEVNGRSGK